jgi:hypothetical protein
MNPVRKRVLLSTLVAILLIYFRPNNLNWSDTASYIFIVLFNASLFAIYGHLILASVGRGLARLLKPIGYVLWYAVIPFACFIAGVWGLVALVKFCWQHS